MIDNPSSSDRKPVEVVLDRWASEEDKQAVEDLFAEFGIPTSMLVHLQESEGEFVAWLVSILVSPAPALLTIFGAAVAKHLADDTYEASRRFVIRLWQSRKAHAGPSGAVVLRDDQLEIEILLEEDLPQEAYQELERLDRGALKPGDWVRYDAAEGKWRPLR